MTSAGRRVGRTALVLALLAAAFAASAGRLGLLEPTETRYAEIAREMRASGDWILPRLNGLPHVHKPPLAYWAAALGAALTGSARWGARLAVVAAIFLTLAFTARIARRDPRPEADPAPPALAAALLAGTALLATVGRSLASDPLLTAAVAGFWAYAPSVTAFALLGVGFLAKGPVVFVPTLVPALLVAAWRRERPRLGPPRGWVALAAIALPWYLALESRRPHVLAWMIEDQLARRYLTTGHHRAGPAWYFAAVLLAGALPWTFALAAGVVRAWRERRDPASLRLLAWLFVPLLLFSASGSKLPGYLLPVFPAVALLAARGLAPPARFARGATAVALLALAAIGWTAGARLLGNVLRMQAPETGGPTSVPLPLPAHAALALLVIAAALVRRRPLPAAVAVAFAWCALAAAAAPWSSALGSPEPLGRRLAQLRRPSEPVVEVGRFVAGIPLALGEPVRLLDVPRETTFADSAERARVRLPADSLSPLLARAGRVWLVGPEPRLRALGAGHVFRPIARWRGSTLGALEREPGRARPEAADASRP